MAIVFVSAIDFPTGAEDFTIHSLVPGTLTTVGATDGVGHNPIVTGIVTIDTMAFPPGIKDRIALGKPEEATVVSTVTVEQIPLPIAPVASLQ